MDILHSNTLEAIVLFAAMLVVIGLGTYLGYRLDIFRLERRQQWEKYEAAQPVLVRQYASADDYEAMPANSQHTALRLPASCLSAPGVAAILSWQVSSHCCS